MLSVHIVCKGNVFRSRLAEAYMKNVLSNKSVNNVSVTSSGVRAEKNYHGPVSWYGARILINNDLAPYMSHTWIQTTKEMVGKADAVIFVEDSVFEDCQKMGFNKKNYKVWDIEDTSKLALQKGTANQDDLDLKIIHRSEEIYEKIKSRVEDFVEEITPIAR